MASSKASRGKDGEAHPGVVVAESPASTAKGAAPARAAAWSQKRSDRIAISIAVEVSGSDLNGQDFLDKAFSGHISRNGASLILNRNLAPDQQIILRRSGSGAEAVARVVGQIGIRAEGHVYGIALPENSSSFWGICFPPRAELEQATARVLLECATCRMRQVMALDEIELSVFEANHRLSRICNQCRTATFWHTVPSTEPGKDDQAGPPGKKPNRRRHIRTGMRASACITQPRDEQALVQVVDVSRGGIRFRSDHHYRMDTWVQVAVPYTPDTANIFVPGRVVWQKSVGKNLWEYGVQYVKS
jgi:hypothetical protein